MIIYLNTHEQDDYRKLWRHVRSETLIQHNWIPIPPLHDWIILSAWDPFGEPHTDRQNLRLSAVLMKPRPERETPVRSWRKTHWAYDGWLYGYNHLTSINEVRRLNQIAAFVFIDRQRHLLWSSGELEDFPAT